MNLLEAKIGKLKIVDIKANPPTVEYWTRLGIKKGIIINKIADSNCLIRVLSSVYALGDSGCKGIEVEEVGNL